MAAKLIVFTGLMCCALGNPAGFLSDSGLENVAREVKSSCDDGGDPADCLKFKVTSLLESIFKKETFQLSDSVEISKNGANNEVTARASTDFFDTIEDYIQSHDVTFKLPLDTKVTVSPRNLNEGDLNLNIKFDQEARSSVEARKSKIKKIIVPILVFVLLKAMTLIPLAIGVLGLKAWNALQLSFFSFVVSVALAIFQLCKKIAADNSHPQIAGHGPWDGAYGATYRQKRSVRPQEAEAHDIAYNAYL